ncbi:MAG: endo-1,4-beta-xylanase [Bacteroidetes bacterium]|nr:MAG: endo-1,4-beta-xylanase [Bacteroidota bacterium]
MMRLTWTCLLALVLVTAACEAPGEEPVPAEEAVPALKEVFADAFLVGAALNPDQFFGRDTLGVALITKHFNTITPENVMKWEQIHPEPDRYDFEAADRFVAFGEERDMFIVGHTLVWHNQTPDWVFEDDRGEPLTREALLERMRDHIQTVVGRYRGRVDGWDVVNEALNEDGTLRPTRWLEIIGEDYLAHAFRFANEADPQAELYYNDYSLTNPAKREGAVRLVQGLLDAGVPVTGIGMQGHYALTYPTLEELETSITTFAGLGVDVMITELDVAVLPRPSEYWGADITRREELRAELDPYREAFPDSMQQALADRYAGFFEVFLRQQEALTRVTFWGVTDGDSWLNDWPIRGRTSYPLLFDRAYRPKPAFFAVVATARE